MERPGSAMEAKKFHDSRGLLGELSNFYVHKKEPLMYQGVKFATSEHLYHFMKYAYPGASKLSQEYAQLVRMAKTPFMSKLVANQTLLTQYNWQRALHAKIVPYKNKGLSMKEDWHVTKVEAMRKCLHIKFQQDRHCRRVLLSTVGCDLIEDSPTDAFWGCGKNGTGKNQLGKLLVELRNVLAPRTPNVRHPLTPTDNGTAADVAANTGAGVCLETGGAGQDSGEQTEPAIENGCANLGPSPIVQDAQRRATQCGSRPPLPPSSSLGKRRKLPPLPSVGGALPPGPKRPRQQPDC